jgi:hypothetical protein
VTAPIGTADEFAHTPVGGVANWQENYVWHAWNPVTRSGWNLHLGNLRAESAVDVRAHVIIDGEVTAGSFAAPGVADCFAAPGLTVEVVVPLEHLRLRFEGRGSTGPDTGGWFGTGAADVPFGFEIEMVTGHPVFDAGRYPYFHETLDVSGNHYEAGARWHGRLWRGDTVVETDGLLIRDHSWGGRAWAWDEVFWVPMVFDGGRAFRFNWARRAGVEWRTISVDIDAAGTTTVMDDLWVRLGGRAIPRQFWTAEVLRATPERSERATLHGDIHLPIRRKRSGRHVGLSDMWSTVHTPSGIGYGTVQIFPTDDQVATGFADPLPRPMFHRTQEQQ